MRFLMTAAPSGPELVEAMGDYDEQLVRAGVLLAGEVLHPSSAGFRTEVAEDGGRVVVRGPFAEAVIAGFWVLQVRSREEMVEWARRCPVPVTVLQVRAVEDVEVRFAAEIREFTG